MTVRFRLCSFFLLITLALSAQQLPPAPKTHIVDVTPKPGGYSEPGIAVNARDPKQVVVAWQVNASAAYSTDGGQNWTTAAGTAPREYKTSGDVSVAFDAAGHAILCYIAFDKLGTENYWAQGATRNGIFIRRSLDGGRTWEANAFTVIAHDSTPAIPFEDKPWIVADTSSSPNSGNLYIGWTQFTLSASDLMFSRSTDDGKSWSAPVKLNSVSGLPRDDNGALEGFHGVVAPDGTLYTVWDDRDGIMMAASHDGGRTFSKDRRIIPAGPAYFAMSGAFRTNGFPQIAIDPHSGRLYVSWSDFSNGDVDVFVASSGDHGHTWGVPVRVNNDPLHDGKDQFFQWMAVDPVSGAVNLIFYDRRTDNRQTTVTLARSTDDGKSFTNYAFDSQPFESRQGDFFGDYLAVTAYGNKVFGAWAHPEEQPKAEGERQIRSVLRVGVADFN